MRELNNSKTGSRIVALDGLRGIAILLVIVYHYCDQFIDYVTPGFDHSVVEAGRSLWFGVDIFFVLSGFLITGILLDTKDSKNYFTSFFGRRTLRIFPLYYLNLAALCLILPRLHSAFDSPALLENQWWFWTYLANVLFAVQGQFGHTPGGYFWSVAVEEQFYLVWPFVVWLMATKSLKSLVRMIVYLLIGGIILRCGMIATGVATPTAVYVLPFTHLDGLLLGALIASVMRTPGMKLPTSFQLATVASVSAVGLLVIGRRGHLYFWDHDVATVGLTFIALLAACALCFVLQSPQDSRTVKLLSRPSLLSFGKYSYAIYLAHVPVGRIVEMVFKPHEHLVGGSVLPALAAFIVVAGSLSWFLGLLSWNLFERHFLTLKKYFPYVAAQPVVSDWGRLGRQESDRTEPAIRSSSH